MAKARSRSHWFPGGARSEHRCRGPVEYRPPSRRIQERPPDRIRLEIGHRDIGRMPAEERVEPIQIPGERELAQLIEPAQVGKTARVHHHLVARVQPPQQIAARVISVVNTRPEMAERQEFGFFHGLGIRDAKPHPCVGLGVTVSGVQGPSAEPEKQGSRQRSAEIPESDRMGAARQLYHAVREDGRQHEGVGVGDLHDP